jgi:hypothetical protein
MRFILGCLLALMLAGCASSVVLVGNKREAITPEQVKIYLHSPKKFEEIAFLDTSSNGSFSFTEQKKMDVVIQRLKIEAAKLGANGILLKATGNEANGAIGSGAINNTNDLGLSINTMIKTGTGIAIFVEEE